MAQTIGFDLTASEEIALAVSELASNLLKHAQRGTLLLLPLLEGERAGIQVESQDSGPGIRDVNQSVVDGFSTAGSLGYGLGTVNRLMDDLEITSQVSAPSGTTITCKRFVRTPVQGGLPVPLEFGVASRAHPLMEVNGDTFVLKQWETSALVGIIDGLGHGPKAQDAALTARRYVETHYDQPLDSIFRGADRACRATRGVVMALAHFDWKAGLSNISLTFASIGNIEVRVIGKREAMNFVIRRGIVGVNAPTPTVTAHRWEPDYTLVLHSDGVSSAWRATDFPELARVSTKEAAQRLLMRWGKDLDDATVIVIRNALPEGYRSLE